MQFQCTQIVLRTHGSTRRCGLMSLLGGSQGGNGRRNRRCFGKFILGVAMRSLGKNASSRRLAGSPDACLFLCQYVSFPLQFLLACFLSRTLPYPGCQKPLLVEMCEHSLFLSPSAFRPRALSSLCFSYLCQSRGLVTFFAHLTSALFKAGACSFSVFSYL